MLDPFDDNSKFLPGRTVGEQMLTFSPSADPRVFDSIQAELLANGYILTDQAAHFLAGAIVTLETVNALNSKKDDVVFRYYRFPDNPDLLALVTDYYPQLYKGRPATEALFASFGFTENKWPPLAISPEILPIVEEKTGFRAIEEANGFLGFSELEERYPEMILKKER